MKSLCCNAWEADHPGLDFTRLAEKIYETKGYPGPYYCVATKPQGPSLRTLQESFSNAKLPKLLVRSSLHQLLLRDWLHATCGVMHTNISPQNMSTEIEDDTSLEDIEEQELQDPSIPAQSMKNLSISLGLLCWSFQESPFSRTFGKCDP